MKLEPARPVVGGNVVAELQHHLQLVHSSEDGHVASEFGLLAGDGEHFVTLLEPGHSAVPSDDVGFLAAAVGAEPFAVLPLVESSLVLACQPHLEAYSDLALAGSSDPPLLV